MLNLDLEVVLGMEAGPSASPVSTSSCGHSQAQGAAVCRLWARGEHHGHTLALSSGHLPQTSGHRHSGWVPDKGGRNRSWGSWELKHSGQVCSRETAARVSQQQAAAGTRGQVEIPDAIQHVQALAFDLPERRDDAKHPRGPVSSPAQPPVGGG